MTQWVNTLGGEVSFRAIYDLIPRWNKCVDRLNEYIEISVDFLLSYSIFFFNFVVQIIFF